MTIPLRLPPKTEQTIHRFLRAHVADAQAEGYAVGLSGGIDSALAARLARDAVGPERTHALLLPDRAVPKELVDETTEYARSLGLPVRVLPIDGAAEAIRAILPEVTDRVTRGNVLPRLRMALLYTYAREHRLLVLGTGNKSEILMGYFTKYGDGGVDVLPLGDLYKTQVRELAAQRALPSAVLERPPSAGFWEGQTDEQEMGITYPRLDAVLHGIEELRSAREIAEGTGEPLAEVESILERVRMNRHKRRLPPIPKLSLRTVGLDWRD